MTRSFIWGTLVLAALFVCGGCREHQIGVPGNPKQRRSIEHDPTPDERIPSLIRTLTERDMKQRRRMAARAMGRYWMEGQINEESRALALEALESALNTEKEETVLNAIRHSIEQLNEPAGSTQ